MNKGVCKLLNNITDVNYFAILETCKYIMKHLKENKNIIKIYINHPVQKFIPPSHKDLIYCLLFIS